jgi:hypothetical protein
MLGRKFEFAGREEKFEPAQKYFFWGLEAKNEWWHIANGPVEPGLSSALH